MEIIETVEQLKKLAKTAADPVLERCCLELESQVRALLEANRQTADRSRELETQFAARWRAVRHDVAQPVTVVQTFLELLPAVLEEEKFNPETSRNPEFWKNSYQRALDAIKSVPRRMQS